MMYPYREDTDRLLASVGLGQRHTVAAVHPTLGRQELEVEAGEVSWDERRAPRVRAVLRCRVPDSQRVLDALDPRSGARVEVEAGYVRPNGHRDSHVVADLGVQDRTVTRPESGAPALEVVAESDEALVLTHAPAATFTPAQATVDQAVRDVLVYALPTRPTITGSLPTVAPGQVLVVEPGGDLWGLVEDLADRVGGDVYDNGLRTWELRVRPRLASVPATILRSGQRGTVIGASTSVSRSRTGWGNAAVLTYRWEDAAGVDQVVYGRAHASGGPHRVGLVGRVTYQEDRKVAATQAEADASAAALLPRLLARGATYRVSAVARWWLRPGHTVSLQLPLGLGQRLLCVAASFDLSTGRMEADLRLPDTATTITTGG